VGSSTIWRHKENELDWGGGGGEEPREGEVLVVWMGAGEVKVGPNEQRWKKRSFFIFGVDSGGGVSGFKDFVPVATGEGGRRGDEHKNTEGGERREGGNSNWKSDRRKPKRPKKKTKTQFEDSAIREKGWQRCLAQMGNEETRKKYEILREKHIQQNRSNDGEKKGNEFTPAASSKTEGGVNNGYEDVLKRGGRRELGGGES